MKLHINIFRWHGKKYRKPGYNRGETAKGNEKRALHIARILQIKKCSKLISGRFNTS